MQKLKKTGIPGLLKSDAGSALVGVVSLSLILSIASVGYLQLVTSSSNHEIESLRDAKAFHAAESGLNMGAAWLRKQVNMPGAVIHGLYTLPFGDITTIVDIIPVSASEVQVRATSASSHMPYDKVLSWGMGPKPAGSFGTFLNGILGNNHRAQGGFMNSTFDGPTHSNESMLISAAGGNVVANFRGKVGVHHTNADRWNYGNGAHDNNNYDWGVEVAAHGGPWLDVNVFKSEYRHHQSKLMLPQVAPAATDIVLPVSDPVAVPNSPVPQRRAYLRLNGNQATYQYWVGGVLQTLAIPDINNKVVRANNELCVSGVISGATTVVTNPGFNLYPVGNTVCQGFVPDAAANYDNFDPVNNYGFSMANTQALALVSGRDVFFADQWFDPVTGVRDIQGAGANQPLYITAQLIALEPGGTHRFLEDAHHHVSPNFYNNSLQNGGIRVIGSRVVDGWFQFNTGANQAARMFRVFYDRRFEQGLMPPGIKGFKRVLDDGTEVEAIDPIAGTWVESNIAN